jgi:23S rRNA pseudouridine1911/1915/1917 synthase
MKAQRWIVPDDQAGTRVDAWLAGRPEIGSRPRARDWIERGKVFLNGEEVTFDRSGERLRPGDEIAIWGDRPGSSRRRSRDLVAHRAALRVVFEDDDLLVADKPPGLLVEPLPGDPSGTLARLPRRGPRPATPARLPRWGPRPEVTLRDLGSDHLGGRPAFVVHRIDRDTSGLVLFAKNERAQAALKRQFERRTAERVYLAVVNGRLSQRQGTWTDTLVWDKARLVQRRGRPDDEHGKEAVARYAVVEQFEAAALIEVRLVTGKRNQIRIQVALRNHPLVGERIYRERAKSAARPPSDVDFPRQALHAARLAFRHPSTGVRVELEAPLPADLKRLLHTLRAVRR